MRLYTIQKIGAWEQLQKAGVLSPEESLVEQDFLHAYKWMLGQMTKRCTNFSGRYPVWAWVVRPDLRTVNWSNGPYVMLTLDIPDERVLVSDFSAWHMVLNCCYISEDYEEWEQKWENCSLEEKMVSWELIFKPSQNDIWSGELQACIDQVFLNEVVESRVLKKKNWTYGRNK